MKDIEGKEEVYEQKDKTVAENPCGKRHNISLYDGTDGILFVHKNQ